MVSVEVKIWKKEVTYQKDGVDKRATNFFLQLNDQFIPVEVKYFPQDKFNGRDPGYQGRVSALSLVAEMLPDKEKPAKVDPEKIVCPKCGKLMRVDDKDDTTYYLLCDECGVGCKFDSKSGELNFTDSDGNPVT